MSEARCFGFDELAHGEEAPSLGRVLHLPPVEQIEPDELVSAQDPGDVDPPTELVYSDVKKLLESHNRSTPDSRVVSLLNYAWEVGSVLMPGVSREFQPFMPTNIHTWHHDNKQRVEDMLAASKNGKSKHRYDLELLTESTDRFIPTSPFLANARKIRGMSGEKWEGVRTELCARVMVQDAYEAWQEEKSSD